MDDLIKYKELFNVNDFPEVEKILIRITDTKKISLGDLLTLEMINYDACKEFRKLFEAALTSKDIV